MIVVSGSITIEVGDVHKAIEIFREVASASRREAGCTAYAISADFEVAGKFRLFEEWESIEPLMAHLSAPHIQRFMAAIAELRVSEMTVVHYEAIKRRRAV